MACFGIYLGHEFSWDTFFRLVAKEVTITLADDTVMPYQLGNKGDKKDLNIPLDAVIRMVLHDDIVGRQGGDQIPRDCITAIPEEIEYNYSFVCAHDPNVIIDGYGTRPNMIYYQNHYIGPYDKNSTVGISLSQVTNLTTWRDKLVEEGRLTEANTLKMVTISY